MMQDKVKSKKKSLLKWTSLKDEQKSLHRRYLLWRDSTGFHNMKKNRFFGIALIQLLVFNKFKDRIKKKNKNKNLFTFNPRSDKISSRRPFPFSYIKLLRHVPMAPRINRFNLVLSLFPMIRILSPDVSIPALPARPIICLY